MKPIYAGTYSNRKRGRGKFIFIVIVIVQLLAVGGYLYVKSNKPDNKQTINTPSLDDSNPSHDTTPEPLLPIPPSPETKALVDDARSAMAAGQLTEAQNILNKIVATNPDLVAIKLLGEVNIKLIKSSMMMPGKKYYTIQSGDFLLKVAKKFNTTVSLLKIMNGMESDVIRLGNRILVFDSAFTIRVSKSRNELDLLHDGKLFKRYSVGTGKFGKTPAVEFTIVDKIVEPPWTRPSDNKQIEFGDPENVLGTRWMKIVSADHPELAGFGIHGTWERDSIGQQSSAGCIRMLNEDVEELFDLVPRKTTVIIAE